MMAAASYKSSQIMNFLSCIFFRRTMALKTYSTFVFLIATGISIADDGHHEMEEFLKRELSLSKPYQGVGSSSSSHWELMGDAMVTTEQIRLTSDMQSKQGAVWSRIALCLETRTFSQGWVCLWTHTPTRKNNLSKAQKTRYTTRTQRIFPYVLAMVGNGSISYDHERDGRPTELGGCSAMVRNLKHDTFLFIRYVRRRLTVMMDTDGQHEWRDCLDIPGVRLPQGYYFGASAITGDLSDNHDVISLKVYQLTVLRSEAEEDEEGDEITIPSVDNMDLLRMGENEEGWSSIAIFFTLLFSMLGFFLLIVVGLIVYSHWNENRRKRFY
ncbi:lectin, mannose-binding 2-like a isoform X2 [Esox lucius]|uniref:lectin, mannose-binding 2-like a isoform X2 n=1 Tax=Esox lucius TaxID=8010 RepID=UPI0005767126|nr:lectin, mannose-binding 2-like a isoform X2 [Esox lucius]